MCLSRGSRNGQEIQFACVGGGHGVANRHRGLDWVNGDSFVCVGGGGGYVVSG